MISIALWIALVCVLFCLGIIALGIYFGQTGNGTSGGTGVFLLGAYLLFATLIFDLIGLGLSFLLGSAFGFWIAMIAFLILFIWWVMI